LSEDDPRVIGTYRLMHRLGVGGMGTVYAAVDGQGRRVAVKQIHRELARDVEFRERFRREVALLGRVRGEYVARMLDADVDAVQPWMATEYVPGPTLAQRISKEGPLGEHEVIGFAAALADAVRSLHEADVVHRDLKPSNLILSPVGPRLIDMGIARALDETSLTRTGMVVGSPGWISPEEYRGDGAGPAADVYGWALLVLYAATGRPPFGTGRPEVLAARVLAESPQVSGVPAPLDELVRRALAKEPERRPALTEIQDGCRRAWRTLEAEAEDVTQFLQRTWVMPVTDESQWPAISKPSGGRRLLLSALAVTLGIGVVGGAVLVAGLYGRSAPSQPRAEAWVAASPAPSQVSSRRTSTRAEHSTPITEGVSPSTTSTAGGAQRARSADGWLFLLPPGWTATSETGASGGATCARPADSSDCAERGVFIIYGVDVGREYNLDNPDGIGGTYCPDTRGAYVEERELRTNDAEHVYEYRKYRVTCSDDQQFAAYSAYIRDLGSLIIGRRVAEAEMDVILGSFGME